MLRLDGIHIIVTSYLGKDRELQELRLENHLKQRAELKRLFPRLQICTFGSGYPKWAIEKVNQDKRIDNVLLHDKRLMKCQKYSKIIEYLKVIQYDRSILVIDDDVSFAVGEDLEGQIDNPISQIKDWLTKPKTVPAPLIFFSCKGKLHDLYSKNRPPTLHTAPMSVCGWAALMTNKLKLELSKQDFFHPNGTFCNDDTTLRTLAAAQGCEVLKHRGIFFKQMEQSKKKSTVATTKEEADKIILATVDNLTTKYPWLFLPCDNPKRYKPIWAVRGHKLKMMLAFGALKQSEHGVYPVPTMLHKYLEGTKEHRKPLTDLL